MGKVEYRELIFVESTEIAQQKIEEIKKNDPTMQDLFGVGGAE